MARVLVDKERLLEWIEDRLDISLFEDATALGWGDDEHVRGVIAFDRFTPCDCEIHVASDGAGNWLHRSLLFAAAHYVFVQCGLRRVTGHVAARNRRALALVLHLGFEVEGKASDYYEDDDAIVFALRRRACGLIPQEYRN